MGIAGKVFEVRGQSSSSYQRHFCDRGFTSTVWRLTCKYM